MAIAMVWSIATGESTLSWRVFSKNENTWIYHPNGLMLFSTLSRTIKPVTIDAVRKVDTLTDCIEYDDYLWVTTNAGLYQIDMASQSTERIPLPGDADRTGKLAQDIDYLWLATKDTLFRFDKLGREWLTFPLPQAVDEMTGLWSNGDEVFVLGSRILYRFTTSTEKWNRYPLEKPLSAEAVFYPGANAFKVVDKAEALLYQPASFSWLKTDLGAKPLDIFDKGSELYCTDGSRVRQVNCETGMVKPLNIPNVEGISSITVTGDSLMMVMPKRIAAFAMTQETMNLTEYEKDFTISEIQKILPLQSFLVIITGPTIIIYEKSTKAWQYLPRAGMKQKVKVFSWNEEECALRYGAGYKSVLSGNIEMGMAIESDGYSYDTVGSRRDTVDGIPQWVPKVDSEPYFTYSLPSAYGNLTLHSTDKNDRVMDLFFDNTSFLTVPKKGIYYRGNRDDYLNTLRVGTTDNDQMASLVLPQVSMEGGSVVLETKRRLEKRDRKVARLAGGTGYISSRTITRQLPYRADGLYRLDSTKVIPGTFKVMVDGVVLDTTYYNFYIGLPNTLQFNTSSPIDPVSSLTIEYQVQPVPEGGISNVEIVPSHHYGKLHYGTVTLSPTEWISARVGYTGIDRDSLHSIVTAATPLELRSDKTKLMLKATPEFSYDFTNGAQAGGATLQSRFGSRTGLLFNGRFADANFISTDTLTRGIGVLRREYDFTFNHDIRQELPLSYYQHQRFADEGHENRFEFKSGVHYTGFPFLDLTASRTLFEKADDVTDANLFDSMFHKKDKLYLRLYETSSPLLQRLTHFKKVAYEIAHSEYRSTTRDNATWNQGRVSKLQLTLMPIQRIIMLGEMLYRGSIEMEGSHTSDVVPRLSVQMIDFPKGVDVTGFYFVNYKRFAQSGMSTDTIGRTLNVVLKPGQWFSPLGWFSPRGQISQNVQTSFSSIHVPVWDILVGARGNRSAEIVKEVGVNIFPTDGMLLTNTNKWTESSRYEGFKFQTINRLQLLFDARNIITATYNFLDDRSNLSHNGMMMYDKTWSSWLRTTPALMLNARTDTTGNVITAGPKLTVNLNINDFSILRMLNNIHELQAGWNRINGDMHSVPDISYLFNLRFKIRPNIEFANIEQLAFKEGKYDNFISRINAFVYF